MSLRRGKCGARRVIKRARGVRLIRRPLARAFAVFLVRVTAQNPKAAVRECAARSNPSEKDRPENEKRLKNGRPAGSDDGEEPSGSSHAPGVFVRAKMDDAGSEVRQGGRGARGRAGVDGRSRGALAVGYRFGRIAVAIMGAR